MTDQHALPRVTYSNVAADFNPLHDWLDEALPKFRAILGGFHPNVIAGDVDRDGNPFTVHSPIDLNLVIGQFIDAGEGAVKHAVAAAQQAFPAWSARPWTE